MVRGDSMRKRKTCWDDSAARVEATVRGETPDRVPTILLETEGMCARVSGISVHRMVEDPKLAAEATFEFASVTGADAFNYALIEWPGSVWELMTLARANGIPESEVAKPLDYEVYYPNEGAILRRIKDIEKLQIPDYERTPPWSKILEGRKILVEKIGGYAFLVPPIYPSMDTWVANVMGTERFYMTMRKEPELLKIAFKKAYEAQVALHKAYCNTVGNPPVLAIDPLFANKNMVAWKHWMEFVAPWFFKFLKEYHPDGLVTHNCGRSPYWEELITTMRKEGLGATVIGVNAACPWDVNWWVEFRKKFPDVLITGVTLDTSAVMIGPMDAVRKRAIEVVTKLKPYKRLMIGPVCQAGWNVPLSNLLVLTEVVEEYGRYY